MERTETMRLSLVWAVTVRGRGRGGEAGEGGVG